MRIKLLEAFVIVAILIIYMACRKADRLATEIERDKESVIEKRFFNSNRTSDPTEKALVDFVRGKNEKEHFVTKTVSQIGYPRWDKAVKIAPRNNIAGRGNTDSSLATFYVPFTRDSQDYVNASLVIKAYPSDTTLSYKCDWQYSRKQNNLNSHLDSAEYYAIFFMVLDKIVFGHTQFNIKDTNLFKRDHHTPVKVTLVDSSQVSGRNNLLEPVDYCQDVTISWQDCPWNNTTCGGSGGTCDNCWQCTSSISWTYCWTEWIDTGGGGGGTGGTGGGGGTGGTGGGSTPPDCEEPVPLAGRNNIVDDCGSGWEPPIEDEPATYYDPININGIWYTTTNFPGYGYGFHWKWWESSTFLQTHGGLSFGTWAINYLSLNPTLPFSTFQNWFFSTPEYIGGEQPINPDLITYDQPVLQVPLPSLSNFETYFPKVGTSGSYTQMPSPDVYQLVGGSLYQSHLNNPAQYSNACSIRGSRALLYSGIAIPVLNYGGSQRTQKGGDNKNYVLDAVSFNKFMIDKFGETTHKLEGADANDPQKVADLLNNKNGIYVIINNNPGQTGAGYSGHVDLILNGSCIGGAYTQPTGGVKSIRVWVLN